MTAIFVIAGVAFMAAVAWYVWNLLRARVDDVAVSESVGNLAKWNVSIAQVAGHRKVLLRLRQYEDNAELEVQMLLDADEARSLSQWMRVAATLPG